jgi:hypothetical protein
MYRTMHKTKKDKALDLFISVKNVLTATGLNADDYIYIFIMGSFGEHAYVLGHLKNFRERRKVCLVIKESKKWLLEFFPESADYSVVVPDEMSHLFEELFEISYLRNGFPYVVWTDLVFNGRLNHDLIRQGRLTLAESYAFALEMPLDSKVSPLRLEERTRAANYKEGIYTLLMPDATTVKKLGLDFWMDIYRNLESASLTPIFDNTLLQWPLPNVRATELVKSELVYFVHNKCSSVIGIRSGMLDLLAGLVSCDPSKKLVSLMPIETDTYINGNNMYTVKGVSKYAGIHACWRSANISDIEIDLRHPLFCEETILALKKILTPI